MKLFLSRHCKIGHVKWRDGVVLVVSNIFVVVLLQLILFFINRSSVINALVHCKKKQRDKKETAYKLPFY